MSLTATRPRYNIAQDKITAGANSQCFVSKFRLDHTVRKPFGSAVELRGPALTGGETDILVYPLVEDIIPGTILAFPSGAITLLSGATKGSISIDNVVVPTSTFAQKETASLSGIEQVLTLNQDLAVGDREIKIVGCEYLIEKGRVLKFPNGIEFKVTTSLYFPAGSQEIFGQIVPRTIGELPIGTVVASVGDTAELPEFEEICSIDSIQTQNNSQTVTDFLFKDGQDAGKEVVTRDREFQLGGKEIKGDFGHFRLLTQTYGGIESGLEKAYVVAVSGYDGRQVGAKICVGNDSLNVQNNQRNTISTTLGVDGPITPYEYPELRVA